MGLAKDVDFTLAFANGSGTLQIDVSGWDYFVVQMITPGASTTFKGTNDGGAVTGLAQGNQISATNWSAIQGTDLSTGTAATSTAASSIYKFPVSTRYFQLSNASTMAKLIIYFYKIQ